MRTTLTIDEKIAERIRREVALGKRSLKAVVNEALRRGLGLEPLKGSKPSGGGGFRDMFLPSIFLPKISWKWGEEKAKRCGAKR